MTNKLRLGVSGFTVALLVGCGGGGGNVKVDYIDNSNTTNKFDGTCAQFASWLQK
jgi:hypothetical protein